MDITLDDLLSLRAASLALPTGIAVVTWFLTNYLIKAIPWVVAQKEKLDNKEASFYGLTVNGGALVLAQILAVVAAIVAGNTDGQGILDGVVVGLAGWAIATLGAEVAKNVMKART